VGVSIISLSVAVAAPLDIGQTAYCVAAYHGKGASDVPVLRRIAMGKYAILGGYTAEAWAKMVENPGNRETAVRKVTDAVGAKLEQFFWSFGDDDYLAIVDCPDDITAGAISVAVGSSGSLRNLRTIKLITQEEGRKVLEKAKTARAVYAPPGAREAAGVR
jgi:uncharacterized protein with GYD domain